MATLEELNQALGEPTTEASQGTVPPQQNQPQTSLDRLNQALGEPTTEASQGTVPPQQNQPQTSLDRLNQALGESGSPEAMGFVKDFGQSQEKILKNFNTGVARLFGLPRAAVDLIEAGENKLLDFVGIDSEKAKLSNFTGIESKVGGFLPTSRQIQDVGADAGLSFREGEEPQDLGSRITQNIGTSAPLLPVLGLGSAAFELFSATTAAIGGKIAEGTQFAKRHPVLARAIGELFGGLSPAGLKAASNLATKATPTGIGVNLAKKGVQKIKEKIPSTEQRVLSKLQKEVVDPAQVRANLAREAASPEGGSLSVAQASGDPGIAGISKAVEEADPVFRSKELVRNKQLAKDLKKKFIGTADVEDAKAFLDVEMQNLALYARKSAEKLGTTGDPLVLAERATGKIREAFNTANKVDSAIWKALPSGEFAAGANLRRVHKESLIDVTEGGSKSQISNFAIEKLGDFKVKTTTSKSNIRKNVKSTRLDNLTGAEIEKDFSEISSTGTSKTTKQTKAGELFNDNKTTASAKAIHKFYSELGREIDILSRQPGTRNKIRILSELRGAALDDLESAGLSSSYRKAIEGSRIFNEKFTKGDIGKILGVASGNAPDPTKSLDILVGPKGQKGKSAVEQALRGTPGVKEEIEDFIKVQFAAVAQKNNVINAAAGNKFLDNFDELLTGVFPELKTDIQTAIKRQTRVDDFLGASRPSPLSDAVRENSAVATFLKANPEEEIKSLFNLTSKRIEAFSEIVTKLKQDPTGKALDSFKSMVATEIYDISKKGDVIDGDTLLKTLNKFGKGLIKAKVFDADDIKRFKRIGDVFDKVAIASKSHSPGAIIDDLPSFFQTNLLKVLAVRGLGFLKKKAGISGGGVGTSLQEAQLASGAASRFSKALTNDEAEKLLVLAIKDPKVMDDLLGKVQNLHVPEQNRLIKKLVDKVKATSQADVKSFAANQARGVSRNIRDTLDFRRPAVSAGVIPAANLQQGTNRN